MGSTKMGRHWSQERKMGSIKNVEEKGRKKENVNIQNACKKQ